MSELKKMDSLYHVNVCKNLSVLLPLLVAFKPWAHAYFIQSGYFVSCFLVL